MALKKVRGNLERMFDKNLTDLVRGIRNNKDNEAKFIAQCIEEIKQELRQDNISVKATAVAKLTYLQMLGYDVSWAGFNIIEVMSSSKFTYKRIGYLASSQCFHADTELLMLTTNMIRKDLNAQNQYDAGLALSALACFTSTDLARDLANDIMMLLTSTKPYLRKKAVLMMYKVFLKFPDALRPAFPRLKEKLEDPDSGVQSAAVNVVCELARKNPKNYLSLAPVFFKLMTTSSNNWMLIKIIKLFGALTPLEPRLGKKLIEPLTNLIHSTSAMSLLYECINTVIAVLISISSGMPNHSASIQLCVQKLRILIEDSDQNLKYLGLLAMSKILKTHPKSVQSHRDLIMQCLDDKDESIRLRALDLLYGMVLDQICAQCHLGVMEKIDSTASLYGRTGQAVHICALLKHQAKPGTLGVELKTSSPTLGSHLMNEISRFGAFTLVEPRLGRKLSQPLIELILRLVLYHQTKYHQYQACDLLINKLPDLVSSSDLEVQERASSTLALVKIVQEDLAQNRASPADLARDIGALFCGELNPVAPKAQKKVPLPEGTEDKLDFWLSIPVTAFIYPAQLSGSLSYTELLSSGSLEYKHSASLSVSPGIPFTQVLDQICAQCHLGVMEKIDSTASLYGRTGQAVHICALLKHQTKPGTLGVELKTSSPTLGLIPSDKYLYKKEKSSSKKKKHKKRKSKRHEESSEEEEEEDNQAFEIQVNRGKGEMPEGAEESDGEGSDIRADTSDPHRALDINLDEPLRDEERLPTLNQYLITPPIQLITTPKKKKSSKKVDIFVKRHLVFW
ncbi:AP-3 complex subunit delta-1 [Diaphorina citri]|uniref:AP-3 complex subunit delta-1 n=1 Tax=Diaphorina citri TaxID=121845 RepID=A0A3Q0J6Y4_DIACI|nr:AP-3 complex subunit delta-1 [Diaphorina citri]